MLTSLSQTVKQRGIKQHRTMSCRQDEVIWVNPVWLFWIDTKLFSKQVIAIGAAPMTTLVVT